MFSDWINAGVKAVSHMSNQISSGTTEGVSQAAHNLAPAAQAAGQVTGQVAGQALPAADSTGIAATGAQVLSDAANSNAQMSTSIQQASTGLGHVSGQAPMGLAQASSEMATQPGMLEFIQQSDIVGQTLFGILVLMSLITWYLIVVKVLLNIRQKHRSKQFLDRFWSAASLEQVDKDLHQFGAHDPFSRLSNQALHASDHYARYGASSLAEVGGSAEFVTRAMRKVLDEETARVENGLTILGSIGSTAPFVGLFGTVWGGYHALIGIGLSDGVSIAKIAGPVGEALIMTGLGLAVAIPAVLAFNAFVRRNRVMLSHLDGFAHDLFSFLATGQQVDTNPDRKLVLPQKTSKGGV